MAQKSDSSNIKSPFGSSEKEKLQEKIFASTFAMLAKLADADGVVSKNEAQVVDHFIKQILQLDGPRRQYAVECFNSSRRSAKPFRHYVEEYRDLLHERPKMYEWMVDVLLRVSVADGVLADSERELLDTACEVFGITGRRFEELLSRHLRPEDETPYRILGCTSKSSEGEIREKYQQLASEYDPQRVAKAGLPEEFIKLAEERFGAVKQAYATVKSARNFS